MNKTALLSVYDKTGIVELAKKLVAQGFNILSTGGTARVLEDSGVKVSLVESLTHYPEILDGRVKTLHPAIFGGILARRGHEKDCHTLTQKNLLLIDLVVVNLYPFAEMRNRKLSIEQLLDYIDIGGVSLLRAAAKNYLDVAVLTTPNDYEDFIEHVDNQDQNYRKQLAGKAFQVSAAYDAIIASTFLEANQIQFPSQLTLTYILDQIPRYGENPHQQAAVYRDPFQPSTLLDAPLLHGKKLSYNNLKDSETALQILRLFSKPTVVALKHQNPCAVSSKDTLFEAWMSVYEADPVSIYGGIVATNQVVTLEVASKMHELFLEIILAKGFEAEALALLKQKKNLRLLVIDDTQTPNQLQFTSLEGGLLCQSPDHIPLQWSSFEVKTHRTPTADEQRDLLFAFQVARHVKSNAIVVAKNETTVGIGAGQMNRVGAAKIALEQANNQIGGAVLASDGFIPMVDTIELAHQYGIQAIIQPGGSLHDQDVIDLCNHYKIAMVFTHSRHFKH